MVNKVDSAKQISEIFNLEWKEEFSAVGSTITTIWFENIATRLNDLQILNARINFDAFIEGKNKIPKAKEIAKKTGFEVKEEWFSTSKPGSTSNGGSTVKTPYFVEFLIWSKNNFKDKSSIKEIKSEIIETLEEIYPNSILFLENEEIQFEESDFSNYGLNYNWLRSLRPIWGCLYPNIGEVEWNQSDIEVRNQIFAELSLDQGPTYLEDALAIMDHLNLVAFQLEQFNSNLEIHEITKRKCKFLWEESWDEIDASKGVFEPIVATTKTLPIATIATWAKEGKLDIDPIYQRDFVWNDSACRKLINSILMGVPLPSIILYEDQNGTYQIIDGKQRITSILRFMGALPEATGFLKKKMTSLKLVTNNEMVKNADDSVLVEVILTGNNPLNLPKKDVPKYKQWKTNKEFGIISDEDKLFAKKKLPFNLGTKEFDGLSEFEKLNGKFYHEIRDEEIQLGGKKTKISQVFEVQDDVYEIPMIIYDESTKPYQIRRVFNRYNTQGQKLNPTEINNAAYQSIDAMKFTMAMGRIRPSRGDEILPGIYHEIESDCKKLESFFKNCQESNNRFQYAKLTSWILALLYRQPPKKANGAINYPSTSGIIQQFFDNEMSLEVHRRAIQKEKNILKLAEIFGRASDSLLGELMSDVLNQNPYWRSKKGDDKWAQLSIVSMAAASIICHSNDVNPEEKLDDDEIYEAFIEYLENHEPLDKQQSRKQWEYFAKTITEVCNIFGVDKGNYEDKYDLFNKYSVLDYFADVIENIDV